MKKKLKKNKNITENAEEHIASLLTFFGENIKREGLKETPMRFVKTFKELLNGYNQDPGTVFKLFGSNGFKELITASNIHFYSLCEHHLIPFFGYVHIGYVPNGKILGLSKFARLVDIFAHRLQTQENLTQQISESLEKYLNPQGYIVLVEAEHLCVSMRGIKNKSFYTKTSSTGGILKTDLVLQSQFYEHIRHELRGKST